MIFTPFDLSAAITLRLSAFPSRPRGFPSRASLVKMEENARKRREDERRRRRVGRKWAKREGKRGKPRGGVTRGQNDGLVYESPRNNGSPFYSWSTPLFEGSTWMWKGYHSTPEFPTQRRRKAFSVVQFARRVCGPAEAVLSAG